MKISMRYVTVRRDSKGGERWYWQRKGHKLVRLPADPVERFALATRLNAEAENRLPRRVGPDPGSLQAVIDSYQSTEGYLELAKRTRQSYGTWIKRYSAMWGAVHVSGLSRNVIVDYLATISSKGNRRLAAAVLQALLNHAHYRGLVETNHASRLRLKSPPPRHETLSDAECKAWLEAAQAHRDSDRMIAAFCLMRYTAQRPSDCLAMAWTRYDGQSINLRQEKTKRLLSVPCHRDLRALLDARKRQHVTICDGLTYRLWNRYWRQICKAAELVNKQARDMRRTAIVRLHEAGCEPLEIAHISGHSLADVNSVLDSTYVVRTNPTGDRAMRKWEGKV